MADRNRRNTVALLDLSYRVENVRGELYAQIPANSARHRDDIGVFSTCSTLDACKVARHETSDVENNVSVSVHRDRQVGRPTVLRRAPGFGDPCTMGLSLTRGCGLVCGWRRTKTLDCNPEPDSNRTRP